MAVRQRNLFTHVVCTDGRFCYVGIPPKPVPILAPQLMNRRLQICGTMVGGITDYNDMLKLAAEKVGFGV